MENAKEKRAVLGKESAFELNTNSLNLQMNYSRKFDSFKSNGKYNYLCYFSRVFTKLIVHAAEYLISETNNLCASADKLPACCSSLER